MKDYGTHFRAANKSLNTVMLDDAAFAAHMKQLGVSFKVKPNGSVNWSASPNNFVWHHDINAGIMQLVPNTQHYTGSIFWNNLHPNGVGGMSLWGKKSAGQ